MDHFTTNYAIGLNTPLKTIFVVFRGSQNIKDWILNFKAIPWPLFVGKFLFFLKFFSFI